MKRQTRKTPIVMPTHFIFRPLFAVIIDVAINRQYPAIAVTLHVASGFPHA